MLKGNAYNGTSSDIWSCCIIYNVIWMFESKEDIICRKILSHNLLLFFLKR